MASKGAYKRLRKEYMSIQKCPPPFILTARPLESNILEWHFLLQGPPDSPFEGGEYWGKVIFPGDYPYKPPSIRMTTPNGRFAPDKSLCLSMTAFHVEQWNPSWSIATILTGLLSFMLESTPTTGSINTSEQEKKTLAQQSMAWNRQQPKFKETFQEYLDSLPAASPAAAQLSPTTVEATDAAEAPPAPNPETPLQVQPLGQPPLVAAHLDRSPSSLYVLLMALAVATLLAALFFKMYLL